MPPRRPLARCALALALLAACKDEPVEETTAPPAHALRRLTRAEYDATVRDLLLTEQRPGVDLPADDSAEGFDRIAAALSTSPLHLELYEQAAARLINEALRVPLQAPIDVEQPGQALIPDVGMGTALSDRVMIWSTGAATWTWKVPEAGTYRLSARVSADQAGEDPASATLMVDEAPLASFAVETTPASPTWITTEVELREGTSSLQVHFDNDFFDTDTEADRNLYVHALRVEGPLDFRYTPNPVHDHVFVCDLDGADPRGCARQILTTFTPRAWRRPVTGAEIDRLMARYDEVINAGDPPDWGVEFALRTVLTSPHFLFLTERPTADGRLDAYALASRLSYFLWSSLPDDELTALAADGTLHDPEVLAAQAVRMLRDPRAEALVQDFAAQWLHINAVDAASPDPWAYPTFNEPLRASMRGEMEDFFRSFVGKERPLTELLTSDRIHIDNVMASFYGIEEQRGQGDYWSHYGGDVERGGWLSTAGLLMALSYPARTSPVRRGVWVLDALLCSPSAPPPPGVEGLPEVTVDGATLRERLEQHRADPSCATCHNSIDPLGFAFEHYDGIGRWRDQEPEGALVDASATLPDGTELYGVRELATILSKDPRFTRCVTRKAFTYSHGRAPKVDDIPHLDAAHDRFLAEGGTLDALVTALVTSPPFLTPQEAP
jgi:hypothetical protein